MDPGAKDTAGSSCPRLPGSSGPQAGAARCWHLTPGDHLPVPAAACVPGPRGGSVCHFSQPSPPSRSAGAAAMGQAGQAWGRATGCVPVPRGGARWTSLSPAEPRVVFEGTLGPGPRGLTSLCLRPGCYGLEGGKVDRTGLCLDGLRLACCWGALPSLWGSLPGRVAPQKGRPARPSDPLGPHVCT